MASHGRAVDINGPRPGRAEVSYVRTLENDPVCATTVTVLSLTALLLGIITAVIYPKYAAGIEHLQTPFKVVVGLLVVIFVVAVIAILWFLKRIPRLRETILNGPIVVGVIKEKTYLEIRRRLGPPKRVPLFRYRYEWEGEQHESMVNCTNWGDKHFALLDLDVGDQIALIVDPTKPTRTFIRDYFWG